MPKPICELHSSLHEDMTGHVLSGGDVTELFEKSNSVKQGCLLAPSLFNLLFTCVLNHGVRNLNLAVCIRYRMDGSMFGLRNLSAKIKLQNSWSWRYTLHMNVPS